MSVLKKAGLTLFDKGDLFGPKDSAEYIARVTEPVYIPKNVLVYGPPGSLKSLLCHTLMANFCKRTGRDAMYITLEEDSESHEKNADGANIPIRQKNQTIFDLTDMRVLEWLWETKPETKKGAEKGEYKTGLVDEIFARHGIVDDIKKIEAKKQEVADEMKEKEKMEKVNYAKYILDAIRFTIKNKRGLTGEQKLFMVVIDSLKALESLMDEFGWGRKQQFDFFKELRDMRLFSLVIMELPAQEELSDKVPEAYLADGIIRTGFERVGNKTKTYMQMQKMRQTKHSREKYNIEIGKGVQLVGPLLQADEE